MKVRLPPYVVMGNGTPGVPSLPQQRFHALTMLNRYFRGGLGAGKSLAGSRELLACVLRNAEWFRKQQKAAGLRRRAKGRPVQYIIAAPTYQLIEAGAWVHVNEWLDSYAEINKSSLVDRIWETEPRKIRLRTQEVLKFVSLQRPKQYAGVDATGCWLDEAELADDPVSTLRTMQRRLRDTRFPPELWFMIVTSTNEGARGVSAVFEAEIAKKNPNYGLVRGSTMSNPGTAQEYIDSITGGMSAREMRELVLGESEPDDGAVFRDEFSLHESVVPWKWPGMARRDREYWVAMDWGTHYHALFIEHDPYVLGSNVIRDPYGGRDVIFDELVQDGGSDATFLDGVVERLRTSWGLSVERDNVKAYADYYPRDAVELANTKRYFDGRLWTQRINDTYAKRDGIKTVAWRLRDHKGVRRLFVADRLHRTKETRRLLACLENYARPKIVVEGQPVYLPDVNQNSPWSHGPDALRSYCWPRYSHLRSKEANRATA